VWPYNIIEKDINEMIMNGHSQSEILDIINYNTHSGLGLKMKLNAWSKC
jgi:DNA-binding CsgD family transcriptional regulator